MKPPQQQGRTLPDPAVATSEYDADYFLHGAMGGVEVELGYWVYTDAFGIGRTPA